jgi:hypothetical protein
MELDLPDIPEVPERGKNLNGELSARHAELLENLHELCQLREVIQDRIRQAQRELSHIEMIRDPTQWKLREELGPFRLSGRAVLVPDDIYTAQFDAALRTYGSEIRATEIFNLVLRGLQREMDRMPTQRSLQNKIRKSLHELRDAGFIEIDHGKSQGREKAYKRLKEKFSLSDLPQDDDDNILNQESE